MNVIDGWLLKNKTVLYQPQRAGGALVGTVRTPAGAPLSGVRVALLDGQYCDSRVGGAYVIGSIKPGVRTVTLSLPYYVSYTTSFSASALGTTTLDVALTPFRLTPTIARSPSSSSLTYKRKKGKAKFTLAATVRDARGGVPGASVWLQKSSNGKKWSTLYRLKTNSAGKVSKAFSVKKKGTTYYRWYAPATIYDAVKWTGKQKVRVK